MGVSSIYFGYVGAFDSGAAQDLKSVLDAVEVVVDHTLYSCLNYELGTLEARRGRYI